MSFLKVGDLFGQWWANPNTDLDLNPDLTVFPNPAGLDLSFFGRMDLDLKVRPDLDLNLDGFARLCIWRRKF